MLYLILVLLAVSSCLLRLHLFNPSDSLVITPIPDFLVTSFLWQTVIFAPILEEIVFRKYLLGHLKKYLPWWSAVGLSTFCFAMLHPVPQQQLMVIPLGLLLGWVYYKTGKLRHCVFLHFCNNFFVFALLHWPKFFTAEPVYLMVSSPVFAGLTTCITLFWFLDYLRRNY